MSDADRLLRLHKIAAASKERTARAHEEVMAKRKQRSVDRVEAMAHEDVGVSQVQAPAKEPAEKAEGFHLNMEESSKPKPKSAKKVVVGQGAMAAWFKEELQLLFGCSFLVPNWTVPQHTLGQRLIKAYGMELCEKAVQYFCRNWEAIVSSSEGKFDGAPTVNLLWAMRERIFANVQAGKTTMAVYKRRKNGRDADEFKQSDVPKAGW